ncbi:MAG: AMP-binding protein, partial [Piscinibacter sp.]|nr:AMP-binding protein [Piscinibacter sp.]
MTEIAELEFATLPALIAGHARTAPRRPALRVDDTVLDWAALEARMDRVAAALQRDGVRPGEAIAVCAATSADYAVLFLGALRAGVAV